MIRINLLPFRAARKQENIRQQISVFLFLLAFVFIAAVVWNSKLTKESKALQEMVNSTKQELAKYNVINKEIAAIKKKLKILDKKIAVINGLGSDRNGQLNLLDTMTRVVVEKRMWLTGFTVKGNTVNIKGIAMDNKTVADFMSRLQASELFSSVDVKEIKLNRQEFGKNKMNLKLFQIVCNKISGKKLETNQPANNRARG